MRKYLLAVALAACTGSAPAPAQMDAPANQAFGAKCGAATDTSTECASGVCTNSFDMLGYSICSQKCTMFMAIDPSCPSGTSQMCNKKGYCKP